MTIDILTIFPEMFDSVLNTSILGRAREKGLITVETTDIRPFSTMKHKNTDDYPFGGGAGMLMTPQPIADAIKAVCEKRKVPCADRTLVPMKELNHPVADATRISTASEMLPDANDDKVDHRSIAQNEAPIPFEADAASPLGSSQINERAKVMRIYLSPRGVPFHQRLAEKLAEQDELILLCGHYEGVDQRVLDKYIDLEISVGDYVLTGGELGAMIIADCVSRLVPGVLGSEESSQDESFSQAGLLEYPQYTRPRVFEGMEVPPVLLNGDHAKIAAWRREQAILTTKQRRPEMLLKADLTEKEKKKYL